MGASARRWFFAWAIALLLVGCSVASRAAAPPACGPEHPARDGWQASFIAGCIDSTGKFAGGSQTIHLVPHKGGLYAATGYWEDAHNIWYGGSDPTTGWAQILKLSGPDDPWRVDLELGARHLRAELLVSLTFTLDASGHPLPAPDILLLAATYSDAPRHSIDVFVRDDSTGRWTKTTVVPDTGLKGEDNSVRAAAVHRDRVTGREHVFLSAGLLGIFTGDYDPSLPGKIRWSATPETPRLETRVLSIIEANDSLVVTAGSKILRRTDGVAPAYSAIADFSGSDRGGADRTEFQSIGGIRGLTAIAGPPGGARSLLYVWNSGKRSEGCVHRLDPRPDGTYADTTETCLAALARNYLGGAPVAFVLGAYSNFLPVRDPGSGKWLHLAGFEAFIPSSGPGQQFQGLTATNQRKETGGFYAGAMFALRDSSGHWRVGEVNGRFQPNQPELISAYTAALSPFAGPRAGAIYFGGYDCNFFRSTDTAWVYSTDLGHLLAGK